MQKTRSQLLVLMALGLAVATASCDSPASTYALDGGGSEAFNVLPNVVTISAIGDTFQLQANLKNPSLEAVSPQLVKWSSSNPEVAAVDARGRVVSLALGETVITGRYAGHQNSSRIVSQADLEAVIVEAQDSALVLGNTLAFSGKGIDGRGLEIPGAAWSWRSSNPAVASVNSNGVVTSKSVGTTTISAEAQGVRGTADLAIVPVPVQSIRLTPSSLTLEEGLPGTFSAVALDSAGGTLDRGVEWTISNGSVAEVQDGQLMAKGAGTTTVVASIGGVSSAASLTVTPTPVKAVNVVPAFVKVQEGSILQLATTLRDSDGRQLSTRPVQWKSADTTVANVVDGKVTAVGPGTTALTATFASIVTTVPVTIDAKDGGGSGGGGGGGGDTGGGGDSGSGGGDSGGDGGDSGSGGGDGGSGGGGDSGGGGSGGGGDSGGSGGGGSGGGGGGSGGGSGGNTQDIGNRAFPTAQGFGARALTGCNRSNVQVLFVTNGNGSGSGSLRAALDQNDPNRLSIVIFRYAGTVNLNYRLNTGCIYIAGQTAPGHGVQLYANGTGVFSIDRNGNGRNIAVRYVRFRSDKGEPGKQDVVTILGGSHIIFDHISAQFGNDEVFSITPIAAGSGGTDIRDVTVQRSIIAAGLRSHSAGTLMKPPDDLSRSVAGISLHHNLWAHNAHRNPRVNQITNLQIVNNVVYNYRNRAMKFSHGARADVLKNYIRTGPWTGNTSRVFQHQDDGALSRLFLDGNIADPFQTNPSANQQNLIRYATSHGAVPGGVFASGRLAHSPIPILEESAQSAYNSVVGDVGANKRVTCDGSWTGISDALDQRILNDVRNRTGPANDSQADHPNDYGGIPSLPGGTACADADNDGMPDAFENRYGLNPNNANDASQDPDGDGYTNIEEYVNGTRPR